MSVLLVLTLLAYAAIISPGIFYLLALSPASAKMTAPTYIETRQLIDFQLRRVLYKVYYLSFILLVILIIVTICHSLYLLLACSAFSMLMLAIDVFISIKRNVPINRMVNEWSGSNYPSNWREHRDKWLFAFFIRQAMNITGFVSLVVGIICGV